MNLTTQIIAETTPDLVKSLHCSFDHQFKILSSQHTLNQSKVPPNALSIIHQLIEDYLTQGNEQNPPYCVMTYNINFNQLDLKAIIQLCGKVWKMAISEYNPKIGTFKQIKIKQNNQSYLQAPTHTNFTYYIELCSKNQHSIFRCYFLPTIAKGSHNDNYHSLHQSFKLIRAIKDYVSLDIYAQETFIFDDTICANLSEFLYLNQVKNIKILLNLDGSDLDKRVQQQVGEIRLPQPWLDKPEYRCKKKQIYCLHRDDRFLVRKVKKMKTEIVNTINSLEQLMGLELQKSDNVSIDTLKKIKAVGINDKVALIKQLTNHSLNLDKRQKELQTLKHESQLKKNDLQKNQIKELMNLKKVVLTLQAEEPTPKYTCTQRFIYTRNKQSTIQNKLMKTIFTRTNKQEEENFIDESWKICENNIRVSNENSSNRLHDKQKQNKNQFKCAEKRVANVIKQGNKLNQQLDIHKVREQYQNQILSIDFQMQKKLLQKQTKYQKASYALKKLMEQSQDMHFDSQ